MGNNMTTEHRCFCELAPLYALNVLSESDRRWIEDQIAADEDLAMELAELEAVVAKIPYGTSQLTPAPSLKNRLFAKIGQELPPAPSPESTATEFPGLIARLLERGTTALINTGEIRYSEIHWKPHPVLGVTVARFHVDLVKREVVGLLKAEPGMVYPLHKHAGVEELFMLQGDLVIGDRVYGSGDYIRSQPNSSHAPKSHTGCMFFFRTSMDDEFLEEVGSRIYSDGQQV
jgi:quercetin dioxygenase-like cupin family protein